MPGRRPGPAPRILTGNNVLGDVSQGLGRAPVLPEPSKRRRVVRTKSEHFVRHRDESVQIEWARLAHSHTSDSAFVATVNGFPQLPGQHPCSSHAQRARLQERWRHQQVEDILLHAVEVDLPGDDSRACGSTPEDDKLIGCPNDGEAVVQPIGVRQPHRRGPACGLGALGRLRHADVLINGWCHCRHIQSAPRGFLQTPVAFRRSSSRADPTLRFQPSE
jgi:hypothetical protein